MFNRLKSLFADKESIGDIKNLEEILISADLSVEAARAIIAALPKSAEPAALRTALKTELNNLLLPAAQELQLPATSSNNPNIILFNGVNGGGKTTSIGKCAHYYKQRGHNILLVGGDTYRAAAAEQLEIWARRAGVDCLLATSAQKEAAALVYAAIEKARNEDYDLVLIDTAGRQNNNADLMAELAKIKRVIEKQNITPISLLVLDATTGQSSLSQARDFASAAGLDGVILTKLDTSARGGAVVGLANMNIPIYFIGHGEDIEDFNIFDVEKFVDQLCG